jgi:O-antigen/teichoic acid export membrane protein
MKIKKDFLIEFLWILSGTVISTISLLIVNKILSYYLSKSSFGLFYIGSTLTILATQIFFGPFGNGFSRFYWVANEKDELQSFIHKTLFWIKILTFIFIFVSFTLYYLTLNIYKIDFYMFVLFILFAISSSYTALVYSYLNIIRKRKTIALYQIMDAILKLSFLSFIILNFDKTLKFFLFALTLCSLLILIIQIIHFQKIIFKMNRLVKGIEFTDWSKKIYNFSYPFAIWGIFTWFQMSSDRYFLGYFISSENVAKYAIIFQLGYYPPSILIGNFVQTITPIFYQKISQKDNFETPEESSKIIIKMSLYSFLLVILGFICIFFLSNFIINLLSHNKYNEVAKYLPFMFLSGGIISTAQIISIDYQSKMKMKELMWIKILTSLIGVVCSYYFIKNFGFVGSIYSSIVFSFSYLLTLLYFKSKIYS